MDTKYWNSLAKNFEDHVLEISAQDKHGVLKNEIAKAAKGAITAADLGCGTGSLLPLLSPKFKTVYAVDYAAELLEKAERRFHLKNIRYFWYAGLS
jgi:ubiquinone/menaquinone biosynthesis C-methylase UbiE